MVFNAAWKTDSLNRSDWNEKASTARSRYFYKNRQRFVTHGFAWHTLITLEYRLWGLQR